MKSMGAWSTNELQWPDLNIGYQGDISQWFRSWYRPVDLITDHNNGPLCVTIALYAVHMTAAIYQEAIKTYIDKVWPHGKCWYNGYSTSTCLCSVTLFFYTCLRNYPNELPIRETPYAYYCIIEVHDARIVSNMLHYTLFQLKFWIKIIPGMSLMANLRTQFFHNPAACHTKQ